MPIQFKPWDQYSCLVIEDISEAINRGVITMMEAPAMDRVCADVVRAAITSAMRL